jgi:hypothetical protein
MRSLIWKELRENFKWVPLPIVILLGPTAIMGPHRLMDMGRLLYASIVAAVFGAVLGFLQAFPESQGDKRALLLHRPLSRSRIFLAKVLAGSGLYLLALLVPFAWVVGLSATSGHLAEPFGWPMVLPWLADLLTGLVYYFGGMLAAQTDGRWYGSRCLGLVSGLFCSMVVYAVPEFQHALLAIVLLGGTVALAAWGSFLTGGVYAHQPRVARWALVATYLMSLFVIGFIAKSQLGRWCTDVGKVERVLVDRQGRVLHVHQQDEEFQVTDLAGRSPPGIKSEHLDFHELRQLEAPQADFGGVDLAVRRSYRSWNRSLVKYANDTKPGNENWWYVPDQGLLIGYNKQTKRPIGAFGPTGFARPPDQPAARFQGPLYHASNFPEALARDYLTFPGGVYRVDFDTRSLVTLFLPAVGQQVLWASRWEDEGAKAVLAFVGTNTSVEVVEETGRRLASLPLDFDAGTYHVQGAGRLENPRRYWVWFEPNWYLQPQSLEKLTGHLVEYDGAGCLLARQAVPLRPGNMPICDPRMIDFEPTYSVALSGLITSPLEFGSLAAAKQSLVEEVRRKDGREMWPVVTFLFFSTQFYLPSVGYLPRTPVELSQGFATLMLVAAVLSGLVCLFLSRRYRLAPAACVGWALCGLLLGPLGLLVLLATQSWPARIRCPKCRSLRVVTRPTCEHCGAAHAVPSPDGTEVFEGQDSWDELLRTAACK